MYRLFVSLVLVVAAIFVAPGTACADAAIGDAAPAFVATTMDGKAFDPSSLKGKVVVINFWATWCTACRDEMAAIEAAWREYHGKGLEVLAVSADRPYFKGDVKQVMKYFTFPAAMLDAVSKNELVNLQTVPLTYVIGKDGTVKSIFSPQTTPLVEAAFMDEIKHLLDQNDGAKDAKKDDSKTEAKAEIK